MFTPGIRLLSTVTASNSATVDIETTFNSTYDAYIIEASGVTVQTNTVALRFLMKIGGSYVGTGYYQAADSVSNISNGANGEVLDAVSNNANASISLTMRVHNPTATGYKAVYFSGVHHNNSDTDLRISGACSNSGTGALTGIRFQCSSGNIVAGSFRLYGVRKT